MAEGRSERVIKYVLPFSLISTMSLMCYLFCSYYNVKLVVMVLPIPSGNDMPEFKFLPHWHRGCRTTVTSLSTSRPSTSAARGFIGPAEVLRPTTVYVFTGTGSQEPGMDMDLYSSCPAARAVWTRLGHPFKFARRLRSLHRRDPQGQPEEEHPLWWYKWPGDLSALYGHDLRRHDLRRHGQGRSR